MTIHQGTDFGLDEPDAARHPRPESSVHEARALIWTLESDGWSEREAGNLVALLHGLRPALNGWSEREIEHLQFLKSLVRSGRLSG